MSVSYEYHFTQLRVDIRNNRHTKRQERKTLAERLHVIFPGTVLDTGATKHPETDDTDILTHVNKYFLMHPVVGPQVLCLM
jgi:hypothetical protein